MDSRKLAVGAAALLVASNVYWRHRTRVVKRSLRTAREWEDGDVGAAGDEPAAQSILERAASRADVPPDELPDRIEEYGQQIRELKSAREALREGWADSWWEVFRAYLGSEESATLVVVELPTDETLLAREFAIRAMEQEETLAIAVARDNATFAVGAGEKIADAVAADAIVTEIADLANGGGGGMDRLATGSGETIELLRDAVDECVRSLCAREKPSFEETVESRVG